MFKDGRLFGDGSNLEQRLILDYAALTACISHIRGLGGSVVLTSGTFDMVHIGHARYLERAKKEGDILVVGVDSDEKVKERKGPDRPIIPEMERVEILAHMRSVDIVTIKPNNAPKWALIKAVRPDVLILTEETYSDDEKSALHELCGRVVVLEPQATTSTSAKVRLLHTQGGRVLANKIMQLISQEVGLQEG